MLPSDTSEYRAIVEKAIKYFSSFNFENVTMEEERLALIYTANELLKGNRTGFDLWKHFENLSKMNLPGDVQGTVLNFRQALSGQF